MGCTNKRSLGIRIASGLFGFIAIFTLAGALETTEAQTAQIQKFLISYYTSDF